MIGSCNIDSLLNPVILKNNQLTLEILPDFGGSIGGLYCHDQPHKQILRKSSPKTLDQPVQEWVGNYPLIPFSNRIRDGHFSFRGQEVTLPANIGKIPHAIHGFSFQQAWQIIEQNSQTCHLRHIYPGGDWPWSYQADQYFTLQDNQFIHRMSVTNLSDQAMPAGLGFHPFFPNHGKPRIQAACAYMFEADAETFPVSKTEKDPQLLAFREGLPILEGYDTGFGGWQGQASLIWPELGYAVDIQADQTTSYIIFYSPEGQGFFCFEPVSHVSDALSGQELDFLAQGGQILEKNDILVAQMIYTVKDLPRDMT